MDEPSREGAQVRGRVAARRPVIAVVLVGLAASLALSLAADSSIASGNNHFLSTQLHEVSLFVQETVTGFQQPLDTVADGVELSVTDVHKDFQYFAVDEVGAGAPFRSVSLWRVSPTSATLVDSVGAPPEILRTPVRGRAFLESVRANSTLAVLDLLDQPERTLGFAVRLGSTRTAYVVYGEDSRPQTPRISFPPGSTFGGLDFALFLGDGTSPRQLFASTIAVPPTVPTVRSTGTLGDMTVTIVVALTSRPNGVLPAPVPWAIGFGGLVLTLAVAGAINELLTRREVAEATVVTTRAQYDVAHDISTTLQRALLPDVAPTFPGLEIATRYVAGVTTLDVGGDWYDAIPLDGQRLILVVGDVSGRGLHAATVMGSLRPAIRAYALQGDAPAVILTKLHDLVNVERDGCFATVLCAMLDVPERSITMATAGHPPPLLIDGTGARFLRLSIGAPVGVRGPAPVASTFAVAADATLVVYTDGLVERRGVTIDDGFARLRDSASGALVPVDDLIERLAREMLPHGSDDDLAIIAAGWTDPGDPVAAQRAHPSGTARPARRHFSADPESVAGTRHFVTATLADVPEDVVDVAVLLASELATNAVRHAASDFVVTVRDSAVAGRVRVEVADEGRGEPLRQAPPPTQPGGRGLQIVESLARAWGITVGSNSAGRTVWFELETGREGP